MITHTPYWFKDLSKNEHMQTFNANSVLSLLDD